VHIFYRWSLNSLWNVWNTKQRFSTGLHSRYCCNTTHAYFATLLSLTEVYIGCKLYKATVFSRCGAARQGFSCNCWTLNSAVYLTALFSHICYLEAVLMDGLEEVWKSSRHTSDLNLTVKVATVPFMEEPSSGTF